MNAMKRCNKYFSPLSLVLGGVFVFLPVSAFAQDFGAAKQDGVETGRNELNRGNGYVEALQSSSPGTKAGCIWVTSEQCIDTEEMIGRGHDQAKVDRAMAVKGESMDSLKEYHDQGVKETTAKEGVARDAWRATDESEQKRIQGRGMMDEINWNNAIQAIEDGGRGNVPGFGSTQCTQTTTITPGGDPPTAYIREDHVCEIVSTPNDAVETVCTRERVPTPVQGTEAKQVDAVLGTPAGQNELFCEKQTILEPVQSTQQQSKQGELNISNESAGMSCRRTVWPATGSSVVAKSHDATLAIDTQRNENICTREVWPTQGNNTTNGQKTATLTINNETSAELCRRWRTAGQGGGTSTSRTNNTTWVHGFDPQEWDFNIYTGMSVTPPAGATITNFVASIPSAAQLCYTLDVLTAPSAANGYTARFRAIKNSNVVMGNPFCGTSMTVFGLPITLNWEEAVNGGTTFGVTSTGNCDAEGTAQCPASWECNRSAPTTISGIPVSVQDVQGLPLLYPGSSNVCVEATKRTMCSGTGSTSNAISIASEVPAGTQSISNFQFTVLNPQAGVAVVLEQTPAPNNNWVAVFKVNRTTWNAPVNPPQVQMTWQNNQSSTGVSVLDTGTCSGTPTANCPLVWNCINHAPLVINGINVDAAMAASVAPLFPGAANTCVRALYNRTCSGTASVQTTVSIASKIDPGTTSISNFQFTVQNPRANVSVVLLHAPTLANNWVATFRVDRTSFNVTHPQPQVRMTWNATVDNTEISVVDEGNCSDPGTQTCPTSWQCKNTAPFVVNGITVTAPMAATVAPLFPGAQSNCVVAELSRVCGGLATLNSTISIADVVPAGTTAIQGFTWSVQNPQAGIQVRLLSAPTLQNNWVASFAVDRNYSVATGTVQKPRVNLNWSIQVTTYNAVIQEIGDCSPRVAGVGHDVGGESQTLLAKAGMLALDMIAPAAMANNGQIQGLGQNQQIDPPSPGHGGACTVRWDCTRHLPGQINGIPVTQAMLNQRGPLYPGDGPPPTCLEAKYHRTCQNGGASGVTEISIASHLQPGTTSISNYSWSLIEPGAGVSVQELQQPALGNNWVARFSVTRTNFNVAPVSPKVRLRWNQPGPVDYEFPIHDDGDCADDEETDAFCTTEWTCDDLAPEPTRPVKVCSQVRTPWLDGPVTNNVAHRQIDLRSHVPVGTRGILRFGFAAQSNHASCEVEVTPFPPAYDNMRVTVVTRSPQGHNCEPKIQFFWDNMCDDNDWTPPGGGGGGGGWGPPRDDPWGPPVQVLQARIDRNNPTQVFLASVKRVGNALLPAAHAAIQQPPPGEPGGGWWDGSDIIGEPPLFPGDEPPRCMKATKTRNCRGWTGTECFLNSEGEEICHTVGIDTPPNNDCPIYEQDPECQLIREECADGAMGASGWCYVKSRMYSCKRVLENQSPAPIIKETVSCTGPVGLCADGSCSDTADQENTFDMKEVSARFMIKQTMMNDFTGGSDPRNRITQRDEPETRDIQLASNDAQGRSSLSFSDALLAMLGVGSAYAQEHPLVPNGRDPFKIPDWVTEDDIEDPTSPYGAIGGGGLAGVSFFQGNRRDCMKALGGLLNCCKRTPPEDQAPALWDYIKKNLAQSNNVRDQVDTEDDDPGGFLKLIQNASHEELMSVLTSRYESTMGGGEGADNDENMTFEQAYKDFMKHETTVVKPRLSWYCDNDEFELAVGKQTGTCSHLGSFCQTRILGKCIIKKDRYCCFNSPITRILREHLRDAGIVGMGTARRPQCGGISLSHLAAMNPEDVDSDEVIGRMIQGGFNLDIVGMQGMTQEEIESLIDGANSILGDDTRKNPTDRAEGYVAQTNPDEIYDAIEADQSNFQTAVQPGEESAGTFGLEYSEITTGRNRAFVVTVRRTGSKGNVRVRAFTENGTAIAGTHFEAVDETFTLGGEHKILIKLFNVPPGVTWPLQYLTLRIQKISGEAELSGNASTKIWLHEAKGSSP